VIVPDFFKGKPAQNVWYTSQSEENEKAKAEFQKGSRDWEKHVGTLLSVVEEAKKKWPSVEGGVRLGCVGVGR
jgi:hypothetical protein